MVLSLKKYKVLTEVNIQNSIINLVKPFRKKPATALDIELHVVKTTSGRQQAAALKIEPCC